MNKKESFIVYADWLPLFDALETDAERMKLLRSIFKYNATGEAPNDEENSRVFNAMFSVIKGHLDRDLQKYNKIVEKNRENAKKSRKQTDTDGKRPPPTATDRYRPLPLAADNDNDNDNDNVNDNVNVNEETTTTLTPPNRFEIVDFFGKRLKEEEAGTQAWRWLQYNEQRGWDCLPDWKTAAQRWIEKN